MWCNSWILKDFIGKIIEIVCVGGGIYWATYTFAKITYTIHKIKK